MSHVAYAAALQLPSCPHCGALRGDPCRTPSGNTRHPHKTRKLRAAQEAARDFDRAISLDDR